MENYYSKVRRVLSIVLVLNFLIGLVKVIYGYNTGVLSISSDGYDSLLDAVSNVVGIIAISFSGKPSDSEHRYGHYKLETMASILISFTLFIVAFEIITSAIDRFTGQAMPMVSASTYIVMIITLAVTMAVSYFEKKMGQQYNSDILVSDSEHIKSDALATFIIIISLFFVQAGYTILDPILSIGIALLIIKTGLSILWSNVNVLLDKNILSPSDIEETSKKVDGVVNVHNIRTRGTGSSIFLDMHLVVEDTLSLKEAHEISHLCESILYDEFPEIKDIVIHFEPREGLVDVVNYN